MRYRTIEILDRQISMVRDEKNRRCFPLPVYSIDTVPSKFEGYNIVINKNNIILSGIDTMDNANLALSELKSLFFVE